MYCNFNTNFRDIIVYYLVPYTNLIYLLDKVISLTPTAHFRRQAAPTIYSKDTSEDHSRLYIKLNSENCQWLEIYV